MTVPSSTRCQAYMSNREHCLLAMSPAGSFSLVTCANRRDRDLFRLLFLLFLASISFPLETQKRIRTAPVQLVVSFRVRLAHKGRHDGTNLKFPLASVQF